MPQPPPLEGGGSPARPTAGAEATSFVPPRIRGTANRLLARAARGSGPWLALLALLSLGVAAGETALPAILGRAVDAVLQRASTVWVLWAAALIAGLTVADSLDKLALGAATAKPTAWLRGHLIGHVVRLGSGIAGGYEAGDVATRMVSNAAQAGRAGVDVMRLVSAALPAVGAMIALALIDPWLCLVVAAGIPLLVAALRAFMHTASGVTTRYLEVQGRIAGRLGAALGGARTIAASGTSAVEQARVLANLPELHRHGVGLWRLHGRISAQQALLVPLLEIAVLALAGVELARGRLTPGALLAAAEYAAMATSFLSIVPAVTRLVHARASADRLAEVLSEPVMPFGTRPPHIGTGSIEFDGVSVRAGDRTLLEGVHLRLPGGALIAVVGASGSGKSLLAALAGRLLDPDEGRVMLDGVPLTEFRHDALRRLIAFAFGKPALLGATVADAIGFGPWQPDRKQIVHAARQADADGFVRRLPAGYDNPLEATPLSGGEAQRLGLARAFAHAGQVLILDDVAASLDTVTDYRISQTLATALGTRTRIVVAHRASTAAQADTVVWLESGRVRAVAPHAVLWHDPGYRELFGDGAASFNGNGRPAPAIA